MLNSDAVSSSIHCQPTAISQQAQAGEPQYDGVSDDSSKVHDNYSLDKWTISWEDAIRREHEYRNKVETLQRLAGIFESPSAESQVDDRLGSLQKLQDDISQQQHLPIERPLHGHSCLSPNKMTNKKRRFQKPQAQQSSQVSEIPMLRQTPILQVPQQSSQVGQIPTPRQLPILQMPNPLQQNYWCHVCKINCGTEANLMLHLHGQRHRMNVSKFNRKKTLLEKGFLWCKECNIPCTNLNILAQHRMGKKHLARIELLAKYKAQGATSVIPDGNTNTRCA